MGRYRKSTLEKQIAGTLRPCRELKAPPEYNPYTEAPEPPKDLPAYAQEVWRQTAPGLCQYKILTPLDLPLFKAWCFQVATIHEAEQKLQSEGYVIQSTNVKGFTNSYKSPWASILKESTEIANRLGAQFGLSPSFRQRLQMELPKKTSRLTQLMAGNKSGNPFEGMPQGPEDLEDYMEQAWNSF
jgi:P27 family predicted phage terminase small subunit